LKAGRGNRVSIGVRILKLEPTDVGEGDNDCEPVRARSSGYVPDYRINNSWLLTGYRHSTPRPMTMALSPSGSSLRECVQLPAASLRVFGRSIAPPALRPALDRFP
jgi:hypothetical protein